jgi:DNA invertase Pin-like site-specific DNA recombinase
MERQTTADADRFCRHFGFAVGKRILVDDGVSAWKGLNASPNHQLGQFLADARKGLIPPGDCLLLENYDRLSRQDPWAAIGLVSELRQLGIHIGRLDRMKLLRYDSTDPGDFFEASIEFMRGNSESNAKSDRNGKAWARKRKAAREKGAIITHRLPAWVEDRGGKLKLIGHRAAIVRRIFALSAGGHGASLIVKKLTREKVPAFGASGRWTRAYVGLILKDRRVLGEFQPRRRDGSTEGPPLLHYYPPAISEAEFYAARAGAGSRRQKQGRIGNRVELFSGLLKNARDGDSYYVATRTDGGKHSRVLVNTNAAEGRAKCYSFPLATFESAIISLLSEIDPQEILNGDSGPDESLALAGELASVDAKIGELETELLKGDVAALANVLRQLEARKRELAEKLADAREKAAHPLSESWGETQTLLETMENSNDPTDVRLRLRGALKRIVYSIWLLIMPKGRDRLCAAQVWFQGGERHRDYLIWHRPARANKTARTEGQWWVRSLAAVAEPDKLDLRQRSHARRLETALTAIDLTDEDTTNGPPKRPRPT